MAEAVIDVDSHIWERLDLIEHYLEPEYKHLALKIERDEDGLEYMRVEGRKPHNGLLRNGLFGRMAAGQSVEAKRERYLKPGAVTYAEGLEEVPSAHDPHERIKIMDSEGIDTSFIYTTLMGHAECDCRDPKVMAAYVRAYNDYLADFCGAYPDRLSPVAYISLLDVAEGTKELRRTASQGAKAAFISGYPLNGRYYGDPAFDPFWATAQELDIPVTLHVMGGLHPFRNPSVEATSMDWLADNDLWFYVVMEPIGVHLGFASLMTGGALDRFPDLKMVLLETGCGWMLYWFDRIDGVMDSYPGFSQMEMYPSEYFQRQVWTSMDPDEELAQTVVERFGADRFMWGADYPHSEGNLGAVKMLRESLEKLPEEARSKILGENAVRLYGLG